MSSKKSGRTLRPRTSHRTALRKEVVIFSLALVIGGGIFFYLNFGNRSESEAAVQQINIIEEAAPMTEFSVEMPIQSRFAGNYLNKAENHVNVRRLK